MSTKIFFKKKLKNKIPKITVTSLNHKEEGKYDILKLLSNSTVSYILGIKPKFFKTEIKKFLRQFVIFSPGITEKQSFKKLHKKSATLVLYVRLEL